MNPHYNQNYSSDEIDCILTRIKKCVASGRYIISMNQKWQENIEFINEYNIRSDMQKDILLDIEIKDFCYSLNNIKPGYEHEVLYVFVPQVRLFNSDGVEKIVDIYTKFNIIELASGSSVVVISFHKRNKPISYLFR